MGADIDSFYAGRRVFVSGASGFIGSHLVERLIDAGADVTALVRYNSRSEIGLLSEITEDKLSRIEIVFGNVRELNALCGAMKRVETVFHFASLISIPYSYVHPQEVIDTNVTGTLNALIAARKAGVKRFLQMSSSEVYGSALYAPMDEQHPKQPRSVYAASKVAGDALALGFHYSYDLAVTVCRPFNTFGPRQSDRAVIPTIVAQALRDGVVKLGTTSTTRDFTFVDDTVEGILRLAAARGAVGREINLGSGEEVSIRELAESIGRRIGRQIEVVEDAQRLRPADSEVRRLVASNALARELTGWTPQVPLGEGLERTITWVRERAAMYNPERYRI